MDELIIYEEQLSKFGFIANTSTSINQRWMRANQFEAHLDVSAMRTDYRKYIQEKIAVAKEKSWG